MHLDLKVADEEAAAEWAQRALGATFLWRSRNPTTASSCWPTPRATSSASSTDAQRVDADRRLRGRHQPEVAQHVHRDHVAVRRVAVRPRSTAGGSPRPDRTWSPADLGRDRPIEPRLRPRLRGRAVACCSRVCVKITLRYWSPTSGPWRSTCVGSCIAQNTSSSCSNVTTVGSNVTWTTSAWPVVWLADLAVGGVRRWCRRCSRLTASITPGTFRNTYSTPQKQPAPNVAWSSGHLSCLLLDCPHGPTEPRNVATGS